MGFFRISSLGDTISTNPERTTLRRLGEESVYIDLCNKGQVVWISKYLCELKIIRYLILRNLVKWRETKEPLESEKGQWKSWLKTQHSENEDHGIQSHNLMVHQFSQSVQSLSRVRLCNPLNRSTPGLLVHHQLPEFAQTHIHRVRDAIQSSHPLSSPSPPAPNLSQHQSLFQWVKSSHEVAKVLELQL